MYDNFQFQEPVSPHLFSQGDNYLLGTEFTPEGYGWCVPLGARKTLACSVLLWGLGEAQGTLSSSPACICLAAIPISTRWFCLFSLLLPCALLWETDRWSLCFQKEWGKEGKLDRRVWDCHTALGKFGKAYMESSNQSHPPQKQACQVSLPCSFKSWEQSLERLVSMGTQWWTSEHCSWGIGYL